MKKRLVMVTVGLLLFGWARLHFEQQLGREHRASFFHTAKLDLSLRAKIGQGAFIAALSGFRSLVADGLWLNAHAAWERTEWGRLRVNLDAATSLQPRSVLFWEGASHHMAYNAAHAAYYDSAQPREALRLRAQREYWKLGEDYLLRGITFNPDRPLLYDRLGMLYRDPYKFKDPCRAADVYAKLATIPGAPEYARRFAAYEMALCPGREREAYAELVRLYKMGEQEHLPTLLRRLVDLHEQLKITPAAGEPTLPELQKELNELLEKMGAPPKERVHTPPPPAPEQP